MPEQSPENRRLGFPGLSLGQSTCAAGHALATADSIFTLRVMANVHTLAVARCPATSRCCRIAAHSKAA